MRLLQLRVEARAEAQRAVEGILDAAAEDGGRELTEAEEANLTELRSSIEKLDEQITVLERDAERSANAPAAPAARRDPAPEVQVRSEPLTYEGSAGFRQFLVDMAVSDGKHASPNRDFDRSKAEARIARHRAECHESDRDEVRAVATSNLAGLVNPQYDPSRISRGVYDAGVTVGLLNRYPMFGEGMSITMPRVTARASAKVQSPEGSNFEEANTRTSGVQANIFTVAARTEISVQAVERGVMAVELLQDEMRRAWVEELNSLILTGSGGSDEPLGLLSGLASSGSHKDQKLTENDSAASVQKALDYLTDAKTAIFKAGRRRPTAHIVPPDFVGAAEKLQQNGLYTIPPYDRFAQNVGGTGGLPDTEGMAPSLDWRNVPVYVDAAMPTAAKSDLSSNTGGDQTRFVSLVRSDVPVFFDGPQSFSYEQTLAASGELLLVARGYAAFNPLWRPEAWRVTVGTGMKLAY